MKTKTPDPPAAELQTLADCENAMHRLLAHITKREALQAERDRLIGEANRKYQPSIDVQINRARELETQLQQYYVEHADEIERNGEKILRLSSGVMGMRLSAPSLKLLSRTWSWEQAMQKLHAEYGDRFVRTLPPEIDKRLVKSELAGQDLKPFGLRLEQEEVFYAEPLRPAESIALA
jgi:phage host-nuclease inhibitor protein Gam